MFATLKKKKSKKTCFEQDVLRDLGCKIERTPHVSWREGIEILAGGTVMLKSLSRLHIER